MHGDIAPHNDDMYARGSARVLQYQHVDCDCDPSSGQELLEGHTGRAGHTMVTHSCEAQKHLFGDRVLP